MNWSRLYQHGWILIWLVVVAVAYLRGPLPIDETRYLGVAWEMWLRGDFLVPHLNGMPYSDKPPLLFWLFHAGWAVFGVNEWWPRLVPPLFVLGSLFLTRHMAYRLWPDRQQVAQLAPWIVAGTVFWALYTPSIMFDMPLTTLVVLALLGVLHAGRGSPATGWIWVGIVAGAGILLKGPVMLLDIAFPVLLGPLWSTTARQRPLIWYAGLLGAIILAAGIALAWALPAAMAGGPDYEQAILWGQTADRVVTSFAHQRPWWWYLEMLPLLLFPWIVWAPLWRAFAGLRGRTESGVRFLLAWLLPTFITFCLVSGKQPHYLLPMFPGFALLAAYALTEMEPHAGRWARLLPALMLMAVGALIALLPIIAVAHLPAWATELSPMWGVGIAVVGAGLLAGPWHRARETVVSFAVASAMVTLLFFGGFLQAAWPAYNLKPIAQVISRLQQHEVPVAIVGGYHDQFHFLGRLGKPLTKLIPLGVAAWRQAHPDGRVVIRTTKKPGQSDKGPEYVHPFRGRWLSIWRADRLCNTDGACRTLWGVVD